MIDINCFKKGQQKKNTNSYKWDINPNTKYSFSVADSDYETCPEIKEALLKRIETGIIDYHFNDTDFYEALSKWCKERYHYDVDPQNIVTTPGVVNALYFIIKLFSSEEDAVLVNPPVYNPFFDVVKNNNRKLLTSKMKRVEVNDSEFSYIFDFEDLEEKIKNAKIYILCNPHNPIGRCFSHDELEKIVKLCKKYDTLLVADEIHCDIIMNGFWFTSLGTFASLYDKIILTTAVSKTFNLAGLYFANIMFFDSTLKEKFKNLYNEMFICNNALGEIAGNVAYRVGQEYVDVQNQYLSENKEIILSFAKEYHLKMAKLEGTYLAWLDVSRCNLTQDELMKRLTDAGITLNSGTVYDCDSIGYIRINLACARDTLINGLELIGKVLFVGDGHD